MIGKLKAVVRFMLDPPWQPEGPHPLTLAIPDARSTFNPGTSGLAARPSADVLCPSCETEFTHEYALEMIRCPKCRFESHPDHFGKLELMRFRCPDCGAEMEYGIRHPNIFTSPQWASCPDCQFHWERRHSFSTSGIHE